MTTLGFGALELRGMVVGVGRPLTPGQPERILNAVLDARINYIDVAGYFSRFLEFIISAGGAGTAGGRDAGVGTGGRVLLLMEVVQSVEMDLDAAVATSGHATARKLLKAVEEFHTYNLSCPLQGS